ncbi:ras guanine nucleotide exchange factor domain-containing protein [Phlebopus sp. FC_14]|nr:ras guanine nucleotide exchange factor domain-containing protein [Phlebopus sp. FC_14]
MSAPPTNSPAHSLPIIPTLPPIQMPAATDYRYQHDLRKSISVDSFVGYEHEDTRPWHSIDSRSRRQQDVSASHARSRAASASTMSDGHDSVLEQGFESESQPLLKRSVDKGRRGSLKAKDQVHRRPGDLKLPSRNLPPAISVNMQNQFAHPLPRDDNRRLHSTTSLQSFPRQSSLVDVMSGRIRSGSLGPQTNVGSRNLLIDTAPLRKSFPTEISIAVVGTPGCGKSTFVSEDAKASGVEDLSALFSISGSSISVPFRYTRPLDWVRQRESSNVSIVIHELDITRLTSPPRVDAIVVCYDTGDAFSFAPIANFLRAHNTLCRISSSRAPLELIRSMKYSVIAVALKSDLEVAIDPQISSTLFEKHDVGLVEVSHVGEAGKAKMRKVFKYLLKTMVRSTKALTPPIRRESRSSISATPTASSTTLVCTISEDQASFSRLSTTPALHSSTPLPNSPTRARSASDLRENARSRDSEERKLSNTRSVNNLAASTSALSALMPSSQAVGGDSPSEFEDNDRQAPQEKETRSAQYATLDELLDKLLFLAVSGDDPTFISHFLLTYRRFASPRSILLAMQKRTRQLDDSLGDPMFASFAQMRICHLLESWIHTYPQDFAVPGASGALNALVKSIIRKTHLLHYGSNFLPFLEYIPSVIDCDAAWAQKAEPFLDDTEDVYRISDGEDDTPVVTVDSPSGSWSSVAPSSENSIGSSARERKQSLPLSAKALIMPLLKELSRHSLDLQNISCTEIAEEITRIEAKLFMEIEPRHWLRYTLIPGRKDPESDSIARFNAVSNHLADWVVSLILCHDKPKNRAKQIEKFVDIAHKLRALNNYSALRAFVAGINNSTFQGDETMEIFKTKAPEHHKHLLSWDVLLQHRGAHQAYRMALKNTKGACVPALEVHMSDLIRAHEGNPDVSAVDPGKIHWGKFNMFGRFIQSTTHCQLQCQTTSDYNFPERPKIRDLIFNEYVMTEEMQVSRVAPVPDLDLADEPFRPSIPRSLSRDDSPFLQGRDTALFRRIFQW